MGSCPLVEADLAAGISPKVGLGEPEPNLLLSFLWTDPKAGRETRTKQNGSDMTAKCNPANLSSEEQLEASTQPAAASRLARRSFLKRIGWGGTALTTAGGLLASRSSAKAERILRAKGTARPLTNGEDRKSTRLNSSHM